MPKFFHTTYNKDTISLAVYLIGGTVALFFIVLLIRNFAPGGAQHYTVDPISGERIYSQNTGGPKADDVTINGVKYVNDAGFGGDAFTNCVLMLRKFMTKAFPQHENVGVVKDSVKVTEEGVYQFKVKTSKGLILDVEFSGYDQYSYTVLVKHGDSTLLDYDQTRYEKPTHNKKTLVNLLPYSFTISDGTRGKIIAYRKEENDINMSYMISINTCGDEELRAEAIQEANDFLSRNGYNSAEIELDFPNFCDGAASH